MARVKTDKSFEITATVLGTLNGTSEKTGNKWFMLRTTAGTFFPEPDVVKECGLMQLEEGQRIGIVGEHEGEQVNFRTKQNEPKLTIDEIFIIPSVGSAPAAPTVHANGSQVSKGQPA